MIKSAVISKCERHRYSLTRCWNYNPETKALPPKEKRICWVMLNPSTADGLSDDPTMRLVIEFSKLFGYDMVEVVNLYAIRSSSPKILTDPNLWPHELLGLDNEEYQEEALENADKVVLAWGATEAAVDVAQGFMASHSDYSHKFYHLGLTKGGAPKHPRGFAYSKVKPELQRVEKLYGIEASGF